MRQASITSQGLSKDRTPLISKSGGEGLELRGKSSRWQGVKGRGGPPLPCTGAPSPQTVLWAPVGDTHGAFAQGRAGKAGLVVELPTTEEQSPGPRGAQAWGSSHQNSPSHSQQHALISSKVFGQHGPSLF